MASIYPFDMEKMWADTPWEDVRLDKSDLDEEINASIEVGTPGDNAGVAAEVIDYISDFHLAHDFIDKKYLDEYNFLTSQAIEAIEKFFKKELHSTTYNIPQDIEVFVEDNNTPDEPHFVVSVVIPYDYPGTTKEVFENIIWPFFACVQNCTDPGTFNSPYVFSSLD